MFKLRPIILLGAAFFLKKRFFICVIAKNFIDLQSGIVCMDYLRNRMSNKIKE
jgi:hypothetical protein